MPIRLLITDDHSVVRKGIRTLLEDEADIQIVGEATDGDEAIDLIPALKPDVMLLDITMPRMSGIEVTRVVAQRYPEVRVLIFSMHNNPDYILNAVQSGAAGYLLKDTSEDEILRAVRVVATGDLYYPTSASSVIIRHLVLPNASRRNREPATDETGSAGSLWNKLTPREEQILTCLTEGMSSREIADRFDISPNTVANQRASIIRKAGVKNTVDLVRLALKERKNSGAN
ncbi:DNA-binding response regulator [Fibrisoma montanum]|uniref:DNA-binding response regulator n=1 Tax=Fibrisoma montanum TaxID=2305895 RepID=A0A418MAB7_9BACT|nr:response regulator transcription factor [Fibrisoma montanum]RIV23312.1 DNA-binding response regulator [Fibrisoma montanum]